MLFGTFECLGERTSSPNMTKALHVDHPQLNTSGLLKPLQQIEIWKDSESNSCRDAHPNSVCASIILFWALRLKSSADSEHSGLLIGAQSRHWSLAEKV